MPRTAKRPPAPPLRLVVGTTANRDERGQLAALLWKKCQHLAVTDLAAVRVILGIIDEYTARAAARNGGAR